LTLSKTSNELFPTQEIGSIAKPGWRVQGVSDEAKVTENEILEAENWGKQLSIRNYEQLVELLKQRARSDKSPSDEDKEAIRDWSVRYVLALFQNAGLDRVYSGEQWRVEMYEHLVRNIEGFKLLGSVHSFDYKYFTKGALIGEPRYVRPIHLDEFEFVKDSTDREIKIPITGPYTIVDWSFNEYFEKKVREKENASFENLDLWKANFEARREFILALVKNALRPEIENLLGHGAKWIQIDEPAVTTRPDENEMELFVEAINELTHGFSNCVFSVHNCFSDYQLLARYAPDLKQVSQLALEFANRDGSNLGVEEEQRMGYSDLRAFMDAGYTGGFGLGVLHVHDYSGEPGNGAKREGRNIIESPELVRDRILAAARILKDPSLISVNPDCGLRTRNWQVTYQKLKALEIGTNMARAQVG
jgi:5-methyltetrahydropteroyltriglutamate--homocysteine methyltransferase